MKIESRFDQIDTIETSRGDKSVGVAVRESLIPTRCVSSYRYTWEILTDVPSDDLDHLVNINAVVSVMGKIKDCVGRSEVFDEPVSYVCPELIVLKEKIYL